MNRIKIFLQTVIALFIVTNLLTAVAHAEIQTYKGVGEYFMTDETVEFAKNHAELEAERNILDQISVYIKSLSIMIDNELDSDEIITISAGILRVTDTKFAMTAKDDGINVESFVTAQIDTDELEILLDNAIKNR